MAWTCLRCLKQIKQHTKTLRYVLEYRYIRSRGELFVEMRKLGDIGPSSVVAHNHCTAPEIEGFEQRMRQALKVPRNADHPLLGY